MYWRTLPLFALLVLASPQPAGAQKPVVDPEKLIDQLADTPAERARGEPAAMLDRVRHTREQLESMGTAAFPALIAHRDDQRFSHRTPPTGNRRNGSAEPWTVGDTCIAILVQQISPGHNYKGSVSFIPGIVSKDALPEWWRARTSKSLTALAEGSP